MVNVDVIGDIISVCIGDEAITVPYKKKAFEKLSSLANQANASETLDEYNSYVDKILGKVSKYTPSPSDLVTTQTDWLVYNEMTQEYFLAVDGKAVTTLAMPQSLVDRIFESIEKGIDFMPVVKLWTRFLRNPFLQKKGKDFADRFADFVNMKYVHPQMYNEYIEERGYSEEVATRLATIYQIKITQEGLLNGYKVSTEVLHKYDAETGEKVDRYKRTFNVNTGEIESEGLPEFVEDRLFQPAIMGTSGDAFYCGEDLGHFIKVGKAHSLVSWDQVNTNDNVICVPGLHIGGLYYINNYSGEIHNVFVDPMHIGAIPNSTDGAIRCKQYFVHSSLAGVNGSMYHSSTYAAFTDQEWKGMRKAAALKAKEEAACNDVVLEIYEAIS
jgi:hypothetical protein